MKNLKTIEKIRAGEFQVEILQLGEGIAIVSRFITFAVGDKGRFSGKYHFTDTFLNEKEENTFSSLEDALRHYQGLWENALIKKEMENK